MIYKLRHIDANFFFFCFIFYIFIFFMYFMDEFIIYVIIQYKKKLLLYFLLFSPKKYSYNLKYVMQFDSTVHNSTYLS